MFKVVGIDSHLEGELYGKSQLEENAQFSGRFFVEQIIVCSHVSMHGKTAGNVPVGSKPPCILTGKPPLLSRAAGEQNTVKTQNYNSAWLMRHACLRLKCRNRKAA